MQQQRWSTLIPVLSALLLCACTYDGKRSTVSWLTADSIKASITAPRFPSTEVAVTDFGARGDGTTDCSKAFADAVRECVRRGGGRVTVPAGVYMTGPIHLESNIDLHLADSATVRFYQDPSRYLPVVFSRWEGVELMNYSPFIYAFEKSNVAVTGNGTLDGQADNTHWWPWKGRKEFGWNEGDPNQLPARTRLLEMGESGVPVEQRMFGENSYLRPNFIQPYRCTNVLIEGVTIINSPMWEIHPVLCTNVIVRNIRISSHGPNNDGCDPESCRDVLIEGCTFDTGDDCIAIKSGRNNDGRRLNTPSENIVISNCTFHDGHGGVTIGSEISGGARNIFAERCEAESPVLYNALRIKSNAVRGGVIENVFVRNFHVKLVDRAVIDVDLFYEEGKNGSFLPTIRNITVDSLVVDQCKSAFNLVGYDDAPIENVTMNDCRFNNVTDGYKLENVRNARFVNTTVNGKSISP